MPIGECETRGLTFVSPTEPWQGDTCIAEFIEICQTMKQDNVAEKKAFLEALKKGHNHPVVAFVLQLLVKGAGYSYLRCSSAALRCSSAS